MAEHRQYLCQVQLQLQMALGVQFIALAQIQMIAVRHPVVFCIDFMSFLFVVKFFFGWVTTIQFMRTVCDRIVAVQSCDPIDHTQLKQRDYGEPRWEIVLRQHYELYERRQTADRLHCDRKVAVRNFEHSKIPHCD